VSTILCVTTPLSLSVAVVEFLVKIMYSVFEFGVVYRLSFLLLRTMFTVLHHDTVFVRT
jgi:hypothetical protein